MLILNLLMFAGWGTYAYFRAVEDESQSNANRNNQNTNVVGEQDVEAGIVNPESRRTLRDALNRVDIHSPTLEAMELERK